MTRPIWIRLYEHDACSLCRRLGADLESCAGELGIRLERIDIRSHPDFWRRYALHVPVLDIGGIIRLTAPITLTDVRAAVREVRNRYPRQYRAYAANWEWLARWEIKTARKGRSARWRETFARKVLAALPAESSLRVLELAAGPAINRAWYPPAWRVVVTDWIAAHFRNPGGRRFPSLACDAHALPFRDGTFEVVISTFSLCAFLHLPTVAAEVHRVLRPGGHWFALDHVRARPPLSWIQRLVRPLWFRWFGCRPDRDVAGVLSRIPAFQWTFEYLWDHLILFSHGTRAETKSPGAGAADNLRPGEVMGAPRPEGRTRGGP